MTDEGEPRACLMDGHRRDVQTLELLLTALGASAQERAHALELHQQTQPEPVGAAEVGWTARARAAGCVVWPMAEFTAVRATVHTAIGRRRHSVPEHGPVGDRQLPGAVAAGGPGALGELARWLNERGREAEAEGLYRQAAVAGGPGALGRLADWLQKRPGREAEADRIRRCGLDAHGRTLETGPPH